MSGAAASVPAMAMPGAMVAYETADSSGQAHAVPSVTHDRSLCGRRMLSFGGRPWPMLRRLWPPDSDPCPECSEQVYDQ
jgi:hypothetical protein